MARTLRRRSNSNHCNVMIKLSNGNQKNFTMRREATVSELRELVREDEIGDFQLIQNSGVLDLNERVLDICGYMVEVSSTKFTVHVEGIVYNFNTVNGYIKFDEFVHKLSETSNLDVNTLEKYKYRCKGCERCITKEKQNFQVFQCDCCEEKSLTLEAEATAKRQIHVKVQTLQTSLDAKFMVIYWPNECEPNVRHEGVEGSNECSWRRMSYVNCHTFITLENGSALFENVRHSLQPLFPSSRIMALEQWIATTGDNDFIWAATMTDEPETDGKRVYVDCDGQEIGGIVKSVVRVKVDEGKKVMICGGRRRTIIQINILK